MSTSAGPNLYLHRRSIHTTALPVASVVPNLVLRSVSPLPLTNFVQCREYSTSIADRCFCFSECKESLVAYTCTCRSPPRSSNILMIEHTRAFRSTHTPSGLSSISSLQQSVHLSLERCQFKCRGHAYCTLRVLKRSYHGWCYSVGQHRYHASEGYSTCPRYPTSE